MVSVYDLASGGRMPAEDQRRLLGGKGASLVAMHRLGLPVPPAIVVTTDACRFFLRHGNLPPGLLHEVETRLGEIETVVGRKLDDAARPLLLSVRSGAPVSMPGMMDTVLNLGITEGTLGGLASMFGNRQFANDAARRFLESYGSVVLGCDADEFAAAAEAIHGGQDGGDDRLDDVLDAYRRVIVDACGREVPSTGREQLRQAIEAVFRSWENPRARAYRELEGLSDDLGTAVTIQAMVFGNLDDASGTGVAFSRDPNTGEASLYGDFMFRAQGEDVVSGQHATLPLQSIESRLPRVWEALVRTCAVLEGEFGDMVDLEFTVESGRFWMLQARRGKRAAVAAVRIAVELAEEGLIARSDALRRITSRQLARLDRPYIDPCEDYPVLTTGLGASPGVATGKVVLTADNVLTQDTEDPIILVRPETSPRDIHGMALAAGILTAAGGLVSHAAVVARDMGTPAVVGAAELSIDAAAGTVTVGEVKIHAGDVVTIDGATGEVILGGVQCIDPEPSQHLFTLLSWADDAAGDRALPNGSPTQRLEVAHAALDRESALPVRGHSVTSR